jgi:hypothetical protein
LRPSTLFLALCLATSPVVAHAGTFSFSAIGSGGGFSGSGELTASPNGDGSYTITGITGSEVVNLIDQDAFFSNDNLLFPAGMRLLDVNGFAFTDVLGGLSYSVNIFSTVSGYEAITLDSDGDFTDTPVAFTLSGGSAVTPEPSSVLLLGSGLGGFASLLRRRRQS